MNEAVAGLSHVISILIVGLLAFVLPPARIANRHSQVLRRLVTHGMLALWLTSLALAIIGCWTGFSHPSAAFSAVGSAGWLGPAFPRLLFLDATGSLMLVLVSFLGWVVSRYSVRYLDGEHSQGRYFQWLAFTLGTVCLMVLSADLLFFLLCWIATSLGLHQLLVHYRERPAAHQAAWRKFTFSRIGDLCLIAAAGMIYQSFGTLDFQQLAARSSELLAAGTLPGELWLSAWLLVIGAAAKTAQFPFHTWLPETMETPTPVSALMHAGIVNAGGFLLIRLSGLLSMSGGAMMGLVVIGLTTTVLGATVMLTQPSIKRSLAYSTIAQMGFMMLQCGLGAFSAAMLHIIAHSLYKAHAFLNCGDLNRQAQQLKHIEPPRSHPAARFSYYGVSAIIAVVGLLMWRSATAAGAVNQSNLLPLAIINWLALTTWGGRLIPLGDWRLTFASLSGMVAMLAIYSSALMLVDSLLQLNQTSLLLLPANGALLLLVIVGFGLLAILMLAVDHPRAAAWLEPLRVHVSNGFYVESFYRQLFQSLRNS